jgi:hypothetical protein
LKRIGTRTYFLYDAHVLITNTKIKVLVTPSVATSIPLKLLHTRIEVTITFINTTLHVLEVFATPIMALVDTPIIKQLETSTTTVTK